MAIDKDKVVQIHYVLTDSEGNETENTYEQDPIAYLHGHGNIFEALEELLAGKEKGEKFSATLPPEKTYGKRQENSTQRISKKYLKHAGKFKAGDAITVNTDDGPRLVTVIKVGHAMVDVDTNHPLAGSELTFNVEVIDIRDATEDELKHGHAHGPGGHHH